MSYKERTIHKVFLKPYPDELLYSMIARYHQVRCNVRFWQTMEELFDDKRAKSSTVIPKKITKLKKYGVDTKKLLMNNTQYPLFGAFLSADVEKGIMERIFADNDNLGTRTIMSGIVRTVSKFRFCPQCVEEDTEKYGYSYWHRLHQTPGVLTCEKHHCLLSTSTVDVSFFPKEYLPAVRKTLKAEPLPSYSDYDKKLMLCLTKDIQYLYENAEKVRKAVLDCGDNFKANFIWLCIRNGYATKNGSLRIKEFTDAFNRQFPSSFLETIGLSMEGNKKLWIIWLFRKKSGKNISDPLKYLLMSEFLCGSFKSLIEDYLQYRHVFREEKSLDCDMETKRRYRNRWLVACKKAGSNYLKDARKFDNHAYLWLLHNDKEWFNGNAVYIGLGRGGGTITEYDWQAKDEHYSSLVDGAAQTIRSETEKIEKITKSSILRRIGLYQLHPDRYCLMPKTACAIERNVESTEDFRLRKMKMAMQDFLRKGKTITKWDILRKAGVPYKRADEYWVKFNTQEKQFIYESCKHIEFVDNVKCENLGVSVHSVV